MGNTAVGDEEYVLQLCDDILGEAGSRQHLVDWFVGGPGIPARQAGLPVGACWPAHGLVVEYRGPGHERSPDRGGSPVHGLRLLVIRPGDLDADERGSLRRAPERDRAALAALLAPLTRSSHRHRGDKERALRAFRHWLAGQGWTPVALSGPHTDIEALREGQRLIGQVAGPGQDPATAIDTAYGALLRRMNDPGAHTRYALIVPGAAAWHARRVPAAVRHRLGIDLYAVGADGSVERLGSPLR